MNNNFESQVASPIVEYGYPIIAFVAVAILIWLTFSRSGRAFSTGLGNVVFVSVVLGLLWVLVLSLIASFFGLIKLFLA